MHENKRLFFGFETSAPWPSELPEGRLLDESIRHLTIVFLGQTNYTKLQKALPTIPEPPFKIGPVGKFVKCLFLPKRHPSVVAWEVEWFEHYIDFASYQKKLLEWLTHFGISFDVKESFLPHVTICRKPANKKNWADSFSILPMMIKSLNLYESLGFSKYQALWSYPILPAFDELSHTADIAFRIHGESLAQIFLNAYVSLAFKYQPVLNYPIDFNKVSNLDEIIIELNDLITKIDGEIGCPFKAISFHGELVTDKNGIMNWEMIVDV